MVRLDVQKGLIKMKFISGVLKHLGAPAARGKTFVKAYYYLILLEDYNDPPEEANSVASTLFERGSNVDFDGHVMKGAVAHAKQHHGGSQLPIIEEARSKGFTG
jgi:hypothetical protein